MTEDLNHFKSRAVRACVLMHETELKNCLAVWQEAKSKNIKLPTTTDEDYQSLETLLHHIFRAARGYMIWICKQLNLPDPEIRSVPLLETLDSDANNYLAHVLERWRVPLANVEDNDLGPTTYLSNWGTPYCIDAMLEHAVMHPIRHTFQLNELMKKQNT